MPCGHRCRPGKNCIRNMGTEKRDCDTAAMNNELNHLYKSIHASPAVTVDLPESLGTGRIIRAVSPRGTVMSSWKMKYGSDAMVEGNVKDEFRLLFCMGEGAAWVSDRKTMRIDRNEACLIPES